MKDYSFLNKIITLLTSNLQSIIGGFINSILKYVMILFFACGIINMACPPEIADLFFEGIEKIAEILCYHVLIDEIVMYSRNSAELRKQQQKEKNEINQTLQKRFCLITGQPCQMCSIIYINKYHSHTSIIIKAKNPSLLYSYEGLLSSIEYHQFENKKVTIRIAFFDIAKKRKSKAIDFCSLPGTAINNQYLYHRVE